MINKTYVVDNCTLVYFYSDLKSSHILYLLFPDGLKIVPEVKSELLKSAKKKGFYNEVSSDIKRGFLQIEKVDLYDQRVKDILCKFDKTLDTGERFSVALALTRGYTFLTDDWTAQQVIMFSLVRVICKNTTWILKRAQKKGFISGRGLKRLKKKLCRARRR